MSALKVGATFCCPKCKAIAYTCCREIQVNQRLMAEYLYIGDTTLHPKNHEKARCWHCEQEFAICDICNPYNWEQPNENSN